MGIKLYKKNKIDLDYQGTTITVTDAVATNTGQDFVHFLQNRNNNSGWGTTGSNDGANTELLIEIPSRKDFDRIALVEMNFKSYTIQYFDVDTSSWKDFSPAINETDNTDKTKMHEFSKVSARQFKLVISGTMTANQDKLMSQLIMTEFLGEFSFQPRIRPIVDKGRRATKYLSGKSHVTKNYPAFNIRLDQQSLVNDNDLTLIENLYDSYEGFLIWLCGGTTDQYLNERIGYRMQDFFLVNVINEYRPEWVNGRYNDGMSVDLTLNEVI